MHAHYNTRARLAQMNAVLYNAVVSIETLIAAGGIILVTHFISAITGYGSVLLALPLLAWLVGDLNTAVLALLVVGTLQAYHMMFLNARHVDWRELKRMLIWMGIGLPVGYACRHYLPQRPLLAALGVVLIASGLSRLLPGRHGNIPRAGLTGLLLIGGVIHGAFVCGGATLVVYAQHTLKRKEIFRGTLFMAWVILNTVLLVSAVVSKSVTVEVGQLTIVGLPLVLIGNWLGEMVAKRTRQELFMKLVAGLLALAGVITILRVV